MTHGLPAAILASLALATPALAERVSIGFEGPGDGPAPTEMPEDGYMVTTRNMMISSAAKSGDGTDGTNEIESVMNARGGVMIQRPGAPFQFISLDWQSEKGEPSVVVEGYFGDVLIGTEKFTLPQSAAEGGFVTFHANLLAGMTLDQLVLYPQRNRLGMGALDKVVLDEPSEAIDTSDAGAMSALKT